MSPCRRKAWSFLLVLIPIVLQNTSSFQIENQPKRPRVFNAQIAARRHGVHKLDATTTPADIGTSSSGPISKRTVGDWEELHGNFLLRPKIDDGPPRALIHFLGGALVGAAPHISYRYMLERLADKGYLVVATPYNLSFDHLTSCDAVIGRFERIAADLARMYGALPVVGIGHSCGALLQLLITSLFPDTPRAANALISFNNKPASEAIPAFEEVIAPFFTYVAARNETRNSGSETISVGLQLAKYSVTGELPPDNLLSRAVQLMAPPGFESLTRDKQVSLPAPLRDAFSTFVAPATTAVSNAGAAPIVWEFLETLEQIPMLIEEVADGARNFVPPPAQVKAAARRAYRARRTLVMQFTEDPIDESDEIEELLQAAGQVIRMKRPMVQIDVQRRNLPGGHAAPLLAPPLDLATRAEDILGVEAAKEQLRYDEADKTVEELARWLEESNL